MQNSFTVNSNLTTQHVCESFNFSKPELWSEWIERFDRYLLTTNSNPKFDKEKIELLCHTMGPIAKEILLEIRPNYATDISYENMKTEFSKYFVNKKHVIIQRNNFHNRAIQPNERIDAYISELLKLVDKCDYGPVENCKLRERILLGIKYSRTPDLVQAMTNFTLEETMSKEKVQKEHNISDEIKTKSLWQSKLSNRHLYRQLPYHVQSKNCQRKYCKSYLKERCIDKWYNQEMVQQNDIISDLNKQAEKLCIKYDSKVDS